MTESQKAAERLESILGELTEEYINEMSYDELIEYRKKLNVYGRTIQGSDKFLTFSFTNLQEEYMKKLLTTSMIGFLNRMCDEWHVPDGIPIIPVYDYIKDPASIYQFSKDWKLTDKTRMELKENAEWMKKRVIVKEFLEEMFQFNPDAHVRSSFKPHPKDLDRYIPDTPAANLAIENLKKTDIKFREQMLEFDRAQALIRMKEVELTSSVRSSTDVGTDKKNDSVACKVASALDAAKKLVAKRLLLPEQHYSIMNFSKWSDTDKNLLRTACEMIPPADIYHRFKNYYESNYDKLREAVLHLYCDKPEFDIAINPYDWHDSEEDAVEFQKKHRHEVISDIIKAHSGKWNFFAPFAKVRDTMKYFNENTIVLEAIASQIESDAKLGQELMKNRIKSKKKKNIMEDGPDAEIFKKWKNKNADLKNMGAQTINEDSFVDDECPDDGIQVDVWKVSKGGLKVKKDKFYTKAQTPDIYYDEEKKEK